MTVSVGRRQLNTDAVGYALAFQFLEIRTRTHCGTDPRHDGFKQIKSFGPVVERGAEGTRASTRPHRMHRTVMAVFTVCSRGR